MIDRAFEAGATDFISKPVDWKLLQHRVRFLMRAQGAISKLRSTHTELRASESRLANAQRLADVLFVGRGGGSLEDLWAFNEEAVARAIGHSRIPVISAVGHEDHWTIADYTADLRASTPTDAAKQLVQAQEEFTEQCRESVDQLLEPMQGVLDDHTQRLDVLGEQLRLLHPRRLLEQHLRQAQELQRQLVQSTRFALESCAHHLQGLAGRLQALSPLAVLARGYSITLTIPSRRVVTSTAGLRVGDALETLVASGRIESEIIRVNAPGCS